MNVESLRQRRRRISLGELDHTMRQEGFTSPEPANLRYVSNIDIDRKMRVLTDSASYAEIRLIHTAYVHLDKPPLPPTLCNVLDSYIVYVKSIGTTRR